MEPAKPHKPIAALAAIFCLFNGALLYLVTGEFTGDGEWGMNGNKTVKATTEKTIAAVRYFSTSENTIFYDKKEISFEAFCEAVLEMKHKDEVPEIVFYPDTQNGLHQKVITFLKEKEILFRQVLE